MNKNCLLSANQIGLAYERRSGLFSKEQFWAIRNLSFELESGHSLAIIGPNGAGKSTLLRVMAGIVLPSEGFVETRPGLTATLLTLNAGLQANLSGRINAIMTGMLLGMSRREAETLLPAIQEFSELGEFFDEPVATYSSGMRARLGFATAINARADLLLIDEVLGVGDRNFRIKSGAVLKERIQSDQTVVMVSHNLDLIADTCDRAVWIEKGSLKLSGPVDDVLTAYEADS